MKLAIKTDALTARRAVRLIAPQTPDQLHAYIRIVLGFVIPRRPLVISHSAPFAYLQHAYFEDRKPRDCDESQVAAACSG